MFLSPPSMCCLCFILCLTFSDQFPCPVVSVCNSGHVKSRVHKPDRSSRLASGCHRGRDTGDSLLRGAVGGSSSKVQVNDLAPEPATRGSTERLHCPEADCEDSHPDSGRHKVEGFSPKKEPPMRPPPPVINPSSSYHSKGARPKVVGLRDGSHNSPDHGAHRQKHRDRAGRDCSPEVLGACGYNADELRGRQGADGDGGKRRKARSRSRDLQLSDEECSEQGIGFHFPHVSVQCVKFSVVLPSGQVCPMTNSALSADGELLESRATWWWEGNVKLFLVGNWGCGTVSRSVHSMCSFITPAHPTQPSPSSRNESSWHVTNWQNLIPRCKFCTIPVPPKRMRGTYEAISSSENVGYESPEMAST